MAKMRSIQSDQVIILRQLIFGLYLAFHFVTSDSSPHQFFGYIPTVPDHFQLPRVEVGSFFRVYELLEKTQK